MLIEVVDLHAGSGRGGGVGGEREGRGRVREYRISRTEGGHTTSFVKVHRLLKVASKIQL